MPHWFSTAYESESGSAHWSVKLLVFFSFWLFAGFALGTVTLLHPVRWWTHYCRSNGRSGGFESGGVLVLISMLIVFSGLCALWGMALWVRSTRLATRFILPVVYFAFAYAAYASWMNPKAMLADKPADEKLIGVRGSGPTFTFGSFPDQVKLQALKDEGYTGVISLLHPAVVPFEPKLIEREKREAVAVGIEMINLPMLPWVSDNVDSLDQLREIANRDEGRFFIHCYLGADRVNVARRILKQELGADTFTVGADAARRLLTDQDHLERGDLYELGEDVILTPYPTDEEFLTFILSGQVNQVIALLDPEKEGDKKWIDKEAALMSQYRMPFEVVPLSSRHYDPQLVLEAVEIARQSPKPVVVHSFLSPSSGKSPTGEAFLQAFLSGKAPIPPSLFKGDIGGQKGRVVAPNIAVGEAPRTVEWKRSLHAAGVRVAIYVGPSAQAPTDHAESASAAGIGWQASSDRSRVLDLIESGGPYYLYGPGAAAVAESAAELYGPAVPEIDP